MKTLKTTTAALADDGKLDIVFINDGHVAPYHVAWLSGFEDAIKAKTRPSRTSRSPAAG